MQFRVKFGKYYGMYASCSNRSDALRIARVAKRAFMLVLFGMSVSWPFFRAIIWKQSLKKFRNKQKCSKVSVSLKFSKLAETRWHAIQRDSTRFKTNGLMGVDGNTVRREHNGHSAGFFRILPAEKAETWFSRKWEQVQRSACQGRFFRLYCSCE